MSRFLLDCLRGVLIGFSIGLVFIAALWLLIHFAIHSQPSLVRSIHAGVTTPAVRFHG